MKRSQVKNRAVMAAVAAAILLALSAWSCVQPTLPPALSSAKTFKQLVLLKTDNASLQSDYSFYWNGYSWRNSGQLPWDADIDSLVMSFQASEGARVMVASQAQLSGLTANDFTNGLTYTVIAEDGSQLDHRVLLFKATPPPATGPLGLSGVTVMSYNAHDFLSNGAERHDEIATMLKNASADIVVLNETEGSDDLPRLAAALSDIGYPMAYTAYHEVGYEDDIAVISRYPIQSYSGILSANPRKALKAVIRVSNGTDYKDITVIGLHMDSGTQTTDITNRLEQSKELSEYLRLSSGIDLTTGLVVIAGDMNTMSESDRMVSAALTYGFDYPTLDYLRVTDDADAANDFCAVNEEHLSASDWTYAQSPYYSVLDHIVLSPALMDYYRVGSIDVKKEDLSEDMNLISDHFPVLLELDL
ncbi:MAG: endonuclease/exonuclease/phosphatase family protein [Spirochaetales bacterium]|nr:endonuclease/exonuclease/phosphatase family protein [Spirochaetales bacterium]MBN2875672.1 endonuclease/exonuclease/phosphatase family protein [Spirochaetales bacterium]